MGDVLTEMEHGEGAIRMPAKLVLKPDGAPNDDGLMTIGLWGAAASGFGQLVLQENEDKWEMWECEIIIIPRRKYSGTRNDGSTAFAGKRADQMLVGNYHLPECWGPKYYEINDDSPGDNK